MPNQSDHGPSKLINLVRNSLLANDLHIVQIDSVAVARAWILAKLAVVTKHSAELSFLQPQIGWEAVGRKV